MINKIFNEDCLETMSRMADNSVDLILTDPPYGINIANMNMGVGKGNKCSKAYNRNWNKKDWDKDIPSSEIFDEIFRVSKNQIIFGGNYFYLPPSRGFVIWDKGDGMKNRSFSECEMAWTSFDSVARIYKLDATTPQERKVHPTQKPLKLFDYCLRYAIEKDDTIKTVYDPFAGSGTTLIVAKSIGLDYIGSELDKDYYEIIIKRLSKVQGALF